MTSSESEPIWLMCFNLRFVWKIVNNKKAQQCSITALSSRIHRNDVNNAQSYGNRIKHSKIRINEVSRWFIHSAEMIEFVRVHYRVLWFHDFHNDSMLAQICRTVATATVVHCTECTVHGCTSIKYIFPSIFALLQQWINDLNCQNHISQANVSLKC